MLVMRYRRLLWQPQAYIRSSAWPHPSHILNTTPEAAVFHFRPGSGTDAKEWNRANVGWGNERCGEKSSTVLLQLMEVFILICCFSGASVAQHWLVPSWSRVHLTFRLSQMHSQVSPSCYLVLRTLTPESFLPHRLNGWLWRKGPSEFK